MSTHRRRRIDRATAEQILDGRPAGAHTGPRALLDVLAAAAAPGRGGELDGEDLAVAAFREARLAPAVQSRRDSMIKLLTVKAAAAALAATAAGGVAVAASTDTLPTPLSGRTVGHAGKAHENGKSATAEAHGPKASPSPSPSLVGLCRAYGAGVARSHGKALKNPAFSALVRAAGGKDEVPGYCAALLALRKGGTPAPEPTGTPTSEPTGTPWPHPGGKSSLHPNGKHTSRPGGGAGAHPGR